MAIFVKNAVPRPHQATEAHRGLFMEGTTPREICRLTGRSRTCVSRIIQAYRDDQGRLVDAERSGRPKVTSEEQVLLIVAAAVADPFLLAK